MSNPLISIIICTYNRARLLTKTLKSVFAQDYKPVEIVIVDDGSNDDTEKIVKSFANEIFYYKKNNEGIAKARSFGGRMAKGEYIAYQDDDDIMPPDRISLLYEALCIYPSAVFATGDFVVIDREGNLTDQRWLPAGRPENGEPKLFDDGYESVMWPRIPVAPHTTLFRRRDGEKIGWFDDQFAVSEDKDFFARLGQLGPVVYIPKVVSYYRTGHEALTYSKIETSYKMLQLFEKHLNKMNQIDQKMKERLQARILIQLKNIDRFVNDGNTLPAKIPKGYSKRFLSSINTYTRLKYYGYRIFKLPLRRMRNMLRRSFMSTH
jgi:glycosyltransferase involved in cell wall biosynthesis